MGFVFWLARWVGHRNLIRRSLRFRVFEKIKNNFDFEVRFYGYKYKGNLNNFVDRSVFFFGAHEREQLEFSKKIIRNKLVVDCGANVGNHSLFYSRFAKFVISIDANILVLEELKLKIKLNKIKNITSFNFGVGSVNNIVMPFFRATGDNLGVSSFIENFSPQNLNPINVTLRTLDSILADSKEPIGYIKIDVEGFDYEVLKGAYKTISIFAPVIQIEYIPRDKSKLMTFLKENPRYQPRTLIVNQPFFIFNRPRGKLVEFDSNLRGEVFLFPQVN
jgi:FkbM family methyltransferase